MQSTMPTVCSSPVSVVLPPVSIWQTIQPVFRSLSKIVALLALAWLPYPKVALGADFLSAQNPWHLPECLHVGTNSCVPTGMLIPGYPAIGAWHPSPAAAVRALQLAVGGTIRVSIRYSGPPPNSWIVLLVSPIWGTVGATISLDSRFGVGSVGSDGSYMPPGDTVPSYPDPGKKLGDPCSGYGIDAFGDPCSAATGNHFEQRTDFTTAGDNPLQFIRYYNGLDDTRTSLGGKWKSNYDRFLTIGAVSNSPVSVMAKLRDGQELVFFVQAGGAWTGDSDVALRLDWLGSSWAVTNTDDSVEIYSGEVSGRALLRSIRMRSGYTQTLEYDGANQLTTVRDSFGRTLKFTYENGLLRTVAAPGGLVVTYGYDSSGVTPGALDRLTSVRYSTVPEGGENYLYERSELPFSLTGVIDENGSRFASWTYDAKGRALSSEHAGGMDSASISYRANGTRLLTNALGAVATYRMVSREGVPKVSEIARGPTPLTTAARTTFSYDSNGYIASVSDWNTNLTRFLNDARGLPLVMTEAAGGALERSITNTWHDRFHLPLRIDRIGRRTDFSYDTNGNLLARRETDTTTGQTRTWMNSYDQFGRILARHEPRTDVNATTYFGYDNMGYLNAVTNPMGHIVGMINDERGLPLVTTDANGVTNLFTYDARGRMLTKTVSDGSTQAVTRSTYDAVGQLTALTLPDGTFTGYEYNDAHMLIAVTNNLGESIRYLRDSAGNITNETFRNASGAIVRVTTREFDALSRLRTRIGGATQTNRFAYDPNGNQTSAVNGLGHSSTNRFDSFNRLISSTDALTNTTRYQYGVEDDLQSVTDPRLLVTRYMRDGFLRLKQEVSPDRGTNFYTSDEAGNQTGQVDGRGVATVRTFDALNRAAGETFPDNPIENISYRYDETAGGNKGIGRLTGYSDETGETRLAYDVRGNLVRETREIGGATYATEYNYDLADRLLAVTYPSGDVVSYRRDDIGRIESVLYWRYNTFVTQTLATGIAYLPFGGISSLVYGNGLRRTNIHDLDYRPTGIVTASGSVNVQNLTLDYDAANNIRSIRDNLAEANSQAFSYDETDRLTEAAGNYGVPSYTYNGVGNRLTRRSGGVTEAYEYSPTANRLEATVKGATRHNLAYTGSGNVSRDSAKDLDFHYGSRNRLNSLTRDTNLVARYKYSAFGQRLVKTTANGTTHFHYDLENHLIAESSSDGTTIREYVWLGDVPLAQVESSGVAYYIHPDHLNTPRLMTDAAQTLVWRSEEDPFGQPIFLAMADAGFDVSGGFHLSIGEARDGRYVTENSATLDDDWTPVATNDAPFTFTDADALSHSRRFYRVVFYPRFQQVNGIVQNLRFPGQYFDAESGLHYNLMRDYDPSLGRYAQADSIGLIGGFNLYVYARQNPVLHTDPFGLRPLTLGEKAALTPYIPKVDLDHADIHEDGTPFWAPRNARGVTVGNDIYFKKSAYNQSTPDGVALLGHELFHVGQFRDGMEGLDYVLNSKQYEEGAYELQRIIRDDLLHQRNYCPTVGY